MTPEERRAWLMLLRTPGGRAKKRAALERAGSVLDVVNAGAPTLERWRFSREAQTWLAANDPVAVKADIAWLAQADCHFLTPAHPAWPPQLTEIADPPLALFARGNPELLAEPQLAMVGSRNPTPAGQETALNFADYLTRAGLLITSGLALGIDGASHRGALQAGGPTVAVCGTGLDRIYPARHARLARDIAANGVLVSEYPTDVKPLAHHFPERNRLVTGLSLGVLVVEAAPQSGSLISARLANEQGRDVFAIPGSIHNRLAHGCHRLIRDGAKLVQTAADILEELAPVLAPVVAPTAMPTTPLPSEDTVAREVLKYVDYAPTSVDCVVERSGLTPSTVSAILLSLELQSVVAIAPGGGYMRTSK